LSIFAFIVKARNLRHTDFVRPANLTIVANKPAHANGDENQDQQQRYENVGPLRLMHDASRTKCATGIWEQEVARSFEFV
jgi:hypothetical protein